MAKQTETFPDDEFFKTHRGHRFDETIALTVTPPPPIVLVSNPLPIPYPCAHLLLSIHGKRRVDQDLVYDVKPGASRYNRYRTSQQYYD